MKYLGKITSKKNIVEYRNGVTNTPRVSVVVATYNHEQYIVQCLDGILNQKTTFDYEIILGEDDSSDSTRRVCIEYAKKYQDKIRLFLHDRKNVIYIGERPTGRFNLLHGLQASKGQYIALCEGDDYWTDPDKLQKQVDFLESHDDYAVCFHPVKRMQENGEGEDSIYPLITDESRFTVKELLKDNFIQTNSVVYRRQDYTKLPSEIKTVMPADWCLHLYHAQFGKIGCINEVMSVYRRHPGGIWWDKSEVWEHYGEGHLVMYDVLKKMYPEKENKEIIDSNIALAVREILLYASEKGFSIDKIFSKHLQALRIHVESFLQDKRHIERLQSKLNEAEETIKNEEARMAELSEELSAKVAMLESVAGSNSYKIGRKLTYPIRALKTIKRDAGRWYGLQQNIKHVKNVIYEKYGLRVVGKARRPHISLVVRGIGHPTSSTFIRMISPLSVIHERDRKMTLELVDGDRPSIASSAKVVIVQRTALIDMQAAKKVVDSVRANGAKLFVDTDDAFSDLDKNHPQYELQHERVKALNHVIENADEVWFSTPKLQSGYKVSKSKVVRNTLDDKIWERLRSREAKTLTASKPLEILYMGTKTHDGDFAVVLPVFEELYERYADKFRLHMIGVASTEKYPWLVTHRPSSGLYPEFVEWFNAQGPFDIGISPLEETAFNSNKSDIKCLDYLALGVRPIVSDVEAYQNPELDGLITRVKNSPENWYEVFETEINKRQQHRKSQTSQIKKGYDYIVENRLCSEAGSEIYKSIKKAS